MLGDRLVSIIIALITYFSIAIIGVFWYKLRNNMLAKDASLFY